MPDYMVVHLGNIFREAIVNPHQPLLFSITILDGILVKYSNKTVTVCGCVCIECHSYFAKFSWVKLQSLKLIVSEF